MSQVTEDLETHFSDSSKRYEQDLTFSGWFRNIYEAVTSTAKGLWITFRYAWDVKPVTIEYPEVREVLPENSRSRLFNDAENCISCLQCAAACPVDCIYIASIKRPKEEQSRTTNGSDTPIRLRLTQYNINTSDGGNKISNHLPRCH